MGERALQAAGPHVLRRSCVRRDAMSALVAGAQGACGRQNNAPAPYVHVIVPVTHEPATLHGERDLFRCDYIKGFKSGRLLDFPSGPSLIT